MLNMFILAVHVVNVKINTAIKDQSVDIKDLEFGPVVGRGSFASVHRGIWNGTEVALKRIRVPYVSCATVNSLPKEISILRFV